MPAAASRLETSSLASGPKIASGDELRGDEVKVDAVHVHPPHPVRRHQRQLVERERPWCAGGTTNATELRPALLEVGQDAGERHRVAGERERVGERGARARAGDQYQRVVGDLGAGDALDDLALGVDATASRRGGTCRRARP